MLPTVRAKESSDARAGIWEIGPASRLCASPVVQAIPPAGDCLDSWKEIAAHLKRTVRTVQRWERREGLPVHRRLHVRGSSVYASKSEIDIWWTRESAQMEKRIPSDSSINNTPKATEICNIAVIRSGAKSGGVATVRFGSKHHDLSELAAMEISVLDKAGCRTSVLRVAIIVGGDSPPHELR